MKTTEAFRSKAREMIRSKKDIFYLGAGDLLDDLDTLLELRRQLLEMDRCVDPETGKDTTLERVKYLCHSLETS